MLARRPRSASAQLLAFYLRQARCCSSFEQSLSPALNGGRGHACQQIAAVSWRFARRRLTNSHIFCDKGFRAGAIRPRLVEFQHDIEQAKHFFDQWHCQRWLAPRRLLDRQGSSIRPKLLPFWLFEVSVRVRHSATLGFAAEGKEDGSMIWRQSEENSRYREYPWTLNSMQIYASYNYRRDFIDAVKAPGALTHTRPLTEAEAILQSASAGRGVDRHVELDPPTMRQSVAWELAMRSIRMREVALAEDSLKAQTNADVVKDVRISVQPVRRRARIVYFPAYIAQYTFGEYLSSNGERRPQKFMAAISGMGENQVSGERHFNPRKAQLLAGSAVGAATLATGALGSWAWGDQLAAAFGVSSAFWLLIASASAGLAAKLAPHMLQRGVEASQLQADEADLERILQAGLGPLDTGDEEALWASSNREWRRWEQADLWRWNEAKRRKWAENLVHSSHARHKKRRIFIQQQTTARERQKAEEERETRRRERFGESSSGRAGATDASFGGRAKAGRWDFLGYYELLGLRIAAGGGHVGSGRPLSDSDIKRAYREAAKRWHPDRREGLAEQDRGDAHQRFQELSRAYEVLRDPALRKQYDAGQLVTT